MSSVLGIYRRDSFNKTLRIGTPDPSKYHDSRQVSLEGEKATVGAKIPPNSKFGLPGVVIPHAKREGGSMGWNSEAPTKIFIDPEQTNGQIQVDMDVLRRNPNAMAEAYDEAYAQHGDIEDAIVEAFAKFARPLKEMHKVAQPQQKAQSMEEIREAPLQMRGTYVVPKASFGGGQRMPVKKLEVQRQELPKQEIPTIDPQVISAVKQAKSLHDELAGPGATFLGQTNSPMRKVTFELPGQSGTSLGQFSCFYSDVVREDQNLILVYDHSQPSQMIWFPPTIEDPQTNEPVGIAVLVHGLPGEESILYKAFPTGVMFKYRNEQFCLLTIEREKSMQGAK